MTLSSFALCSALACEALIPAKAGKGAVDANAPSRQFPAVIYIDRFSTQDILDKANESPLLGGGADNAPVGPHKQQPYDLLQKLPAILQKTLVQSLNRNIARAAAGDGTLATQLDCWVVRGQFLVVGQGSRATQSHVEIHVQVCTLNDPDTPFLTFDTRGARGHLPGATATTNPYVAATKFIMAKKEPEKETKKVGQQIADEIGQFMAAQTIPTLQAMKVAGMAPPPAAPDYPQVSPVYSSKSAAP
jgi:hypothetical protein